MNHEDYMRLAIQAAKLSESIGGAAIGAILVRNGAVIYTGASTVWLEKDPSAHAETNCIRGACKQLGTLDLSTCLLYGTCEPCAMCVSCAAWASLPEMYFGAYRKDVRANDYEVESWEAEQAAEHMRLAKGGSMIITGGILRDECAALLTGYKGWAKQG